MAQEILQGDIFGRIGKQFGEGIAEQVPRNQLSKQLSGIQGLPPQVAQAALIPGGLEALQPYLPYLQSQAAAQANAPLPQQQQQSQNQPIQTQQEIIPGTQNVQAKAQPIVPTRLSNDPEIQRQAASQEFLRNPAKYNNDFGSALKFQEEKFATQEKQIADVNSKFEALLPTLLHKEGKTTTSEVLGELQGKFAKEAEDSVISGRNTADQAAREYTTKALNFAKARDKLTSPGRDFWSSVFSKNPQKEVLAAKKAYDEAGIPEAFVNDLVANRKFSLPFASRIGFPPSGGIKEELKGIKSAGFPHVADARFGKGKEDAKVFEKVLSKITPNDSLQSVAYELRNKGYSPDAFLNLADKSQNLTPFQQRELQNRAVFPTTLSDVLYEEMANLE